MKKHQSLNSALALHLMIFLKRIPSVRHICLCRLSFLGSDAHSYTEIANDTDEEFQKMYGSFNNNREDPCKLLVSHWLH